MLPGVAWVLDLDGVVWLAEAPIPGAARAVASLRDAGEEVVFCTNNSSATLGDQEAKLARFGIEATGAVLTSALAAAELVEPGERVLVCAGAGVVEALRRRGADPVSDGPAEVVVVGFHRGFDYGRLAAAAAAVDAGARFVATNDDRTYPTPSGPIPGGGAIAAAIAYATGVTPVVAGKPHAPMAQLLRARLGAGGWVVGDRPETDGALAEVVGYDFGLVLSGVTRPEHLPVYPPPALVADDLAGLVEAYLLQRRGPCSNQS
jgi:HAD superfamily hydrolase (TIGR01450 family)